jgi:uncharacterized membrane protein
MSTTLWAIGLVILSTLFSALGPILFKKGSTRFNLNPFTQIKNYYLIGGIIVYTLGLIAFIPSLRGGNLSVLYPILSLKYVWVTLLSIFILREVVTKKQWAGIVLIISGILLVTIG